MAEYGRPGHGLRILQRYSGAIQGSYELHGSEVVVEFRDGRLNEIDFATPYYRTPKSDFGIGSRIPLGRCHAVAGNPCEHRWRGFVFQPRWKDSPCACWVKVGLGSRSLPYTFEKPWFFIFTNGHGVVRELYFARYYID